jgi:hypothetical protein
MSGLYEVLTMMSPPGVDRAGAVRMLSPRLTKPCGRDRFGTEIAGTAPKEQPPRKLSGKRTARVKHLWKAGGREASSPTG